MTDVILSDEQIGLIRARVEHLPQCEWAVRRIGLNDDVAYIVDDAGRIVAIVQVVANQLRVPATFIASARQDVPNLLADRGALLERLSDVEHQRDQELVALEQWQDAHGSLEHAFDTLIEALGSESNVASAVAVIDTLKNERDAYREALKKIEMESPPDTAEECAEIARAALDESRSTRRQTAPAEAQEPA